MAGKKGRRQFGSIRRLPSRRWQAAYVGPDGARHTAPQTFDTREDAEAWLADRRRAISGDTWSPPVQQTPLTLGSFAERFMAARELRPTTRANYESLLSAQILPVFRDTPLRTLTAEKVDAWWAGLEGTAPNTRAAAYSLLRTVMGDAVQRRLIDWNPVHIRGAGSVKRSREIRPATLDELDIMREALPDRLRAMLDLSAWAALRFGEVTELRRADLDLDRGVVHVRRAVVWVYGKPVVGQPKSDAGRRTVALPPHIVPALEHHLDVHTGPGDDALLFPGPNGGHLSGGTLHYSWRKARAAAGRDDLRWHDLRHTAAVMAAQSGATLAELMARLGHTTPRTALIYQHAAEDRDTQIAAALSERAGHKMH